MEKCGVYWTRWRTKIGMDCYVKVLVWIGIELNDENDTLLWSWNTKGGQVNAKQAYEVLCLYW
jgi:hypothetical protein